MSEKVSIRVPLLFLLISTIVLPGMVLSYLGFFTLSLNGYLNAFSFVFTSLDLLNALLFLVILYGIFLMFSRFRKSYETTYGNLSPLFLKVFKTYRIFILFIIPATFCYSLLPGHALLSFIWFVLFLSLLFAGLILSFMIIHLGIVRKIRSVLFLGIVFLGVNLFDYNTAKFFEPFITESSTSSDIYSFLGISDLEYEMLDFNTKNLIEEAINAAGVSTIVFILSFLSLRFTALALFFSAFLFIVPPKPKTILPKPLETEETFPIA